MRTLAIPTWLYLPMKIFLLPGFALPFVLWGLELDGMTRKSEVTLAEHELKAIEQEGTALIEKSRPASTLGPESNAGFVLGIDVSHYQSDVDWHKGNRGQTTFFCFQNSRKR